MEEVTNQVDKKLKRKQRARNIKRGILVVLNAALACYFVYSIAGAISNYISKFDDDNPSAFIKIDDLNKGDSLEVYKNAIDYDENTDTFNTNLAYSYSYYGGYLHFKSSKDIVNNEGLLNFSSYSKYILRNLSNNREYEKRFEFTSTSLNSGIPLFSNELNEGTYIVYPESYEEKKPIKIDSEKGISEIFYSPSINGVRKKIQIKSNSISPCLTISIKEVLQIPSNYYDISILTKEDYKETIQNVLKNKEYKINYIEENENSVKENVINLYKSNASVSLIIDDGEDIVVSSYVELDGTSKSETYSDGYLKSLDQDVYIRELGGDVFASGYGYTSNNDENKWLSPFVDSYNNGSLVIRIGIEKIQELNNLLDNLNF